MVQTAKRREGGVRGNSRMCSLEERYVPLIEIGDERGRVNLGVVIIFKVIPCGISLKAIGNMTAVTLDITFNSWDS